MSNPAVSIPLTVDGVDVQDATPGILLQIVRGLDGTPEVRGTDTTVPARPGRIPGDRQEDHTTIELAGDVQGVGDDDEERRASYAALRQTFRELFRKSKAAMPVVCVLEDGSTATISARTLNTIWVTQVPGLWAVVSVELESVDPDWELS